MKPRSPIVRNRLTHRPPQSWSDPTKTSHFSYELEFAKDSCRLVRDKASPLFRWIHRNRVVSLLYIGLDKLAPLLPTNGIEGIPNLWLSPPPSGTGNAVGLVFLDDGNGAIRLYGSNIVHRVTSSGLPVPKAFALQFRACKYQSDKNRLITETLNAAATHDWIECIRYVEMTSDWFWAMPIYVVVISPKKSMFYCANAVLQGKHQSNMALEACCEITL